MSQLQKLLTDELGHRAQAAPEPPSSALGATVAAIGRRRRVRAATAVAASLLGVVVLAGAGWAVASIGDTSDPIGGPSQSPGATSTAEPPAPSSPTMEPQPSPSASPVVEPALVARDGGAPLASIGDHSWADGLTLPPPLDTPLTSVPGVRQMDPVIWEHVGPGWSLAVIHEGATDEEPVADQRLLLLSPDGEAFELWDLRDDIRLWVDQWRADSLIAWLETDLGADTWRTIALDLRTGERVKAWGEEGQTLGYMYLGTLPDGNDMWQLWSIEGAAADLIKVQADGTATYATGSDIVDSPMSVAWTDIRAGWSIMAIAGPDTPWGAMPTGEITWYRLDHETWKLSEIESPRYGELSAIWACGDNTISGNRVAVKAQPGTDSNECVWLDLDGTAEPVPKSPTDTVAALPRSTVAFEANDLGLGTGWPVATMLVQGGRG